jgi:hypothetical protein
MGDALCFPGSHTRKIAQPLLACGSAASAVKPEA